MAEQRRTTTRTPRTVEVKAPARLHLGMLSFGDPAVRSFGGVGVMIDRPNLHVRLRRAEAFLARGPAADRAIGFARDCVAAWKLDAKAACELDVLATPRSHMGLGSGTQLALAVAAGMRCLHGKPNAEGRDQPAIGEEHLFEPAEVLELAHAVSRGGRSCVGIHGFSRGGLVVEAGRFVPPRSADEPAFSPLVARVRLPSTWRCAVIIQRDSIGLHGEAERQAFQSLPPVPREVTAELSRIALMELVPAAVEGKFAEFSEAVRRYGELAGQPFTPASEQLPHATSTKKLLELLDELGVRGVAQSSWGPAVMACCESIDAAGKLLDRFDALKLLPQYEPIIARFDSQGAVLKVIE